MKQINRIALACLGLAFLAATANAAPKREKLVENIVAGEYVLEEIMADPATAIPSDILKDAQGIIFTLNYRGGFMVGGHAGHGILIAKNPISGEWGVPAFVRTGGATIGLQLGVKEFDAVYVIMDLDTVRKAYTGRIDFGADAAAVAGPLESSREARQNIDYKNAKILVYSNKKGLFAGVAVKAGWVSPNNKGTQAFYNTDYNMPEIVMSDWFELPPEANALLQRLNYYTRGGR
ncbi:lipid-binding SYLF domain-containing protein [Pelagicoccus sp. SDUM812002]|uniref:lipid-binding SYLF domain-containing protein n=1 Tax=Pelagicoccus sp. SDUM812002 TaxID=3041266 RepID=UPI00280F5152|nr:lipid-binding SYLF domain-containing protein [Pelagicoccus sp. SDUM812002]MDQ8187385.1 lipid-binding SYLF domain-containing protein [Pelagicoccus sp. SDUM812002]